jgi:predicted metal-dependent hydrolase
MENEIKGKQELNKYLEHQCNLYLEEQNRIKQEFETYRNQYVELSQKQDQTINILKKEVSER